MSNTPVKSMHLKPASAEQVRRTWENAYDEWGRGVLTTDDFYRREQVLAAQDFAKRGLTVWASVPATSPSTLDLLAHLESFERPAAVRRINERNVETVSCFSIGTVFCPREKRGSGYASALMKSIVAELRTRGALSNLYSDIGPDFYARYGWKLHSSVSVTLSLSAQLPSGHNTASPKLLRQADIPAYAECDCRRITKSMQELPLSHTQARVAILPEASVYPWHFARAQFEHDIVRGSGDLEVFGAAIDGSPESSFIVWTYDVRKSSILVLRAAVASAADLLALTKTAISVAKSNGFDAVEFWNPPYQGDLADAGALRVVRTGSLPMLCDLNGDMGSDVQWLYNEKFAWV